MSHKTALLSVTFATWQISVDLRQHHTNRHRIAPRVFQPLELVPIVDLPSGDGLIYMTAVAANSTDSTYWEGCYHLYTPHDQAFPGTVLSTGMEDFFGVNTHFSTLCQRCSPLGFRPPTAPQPRHPASSRKMDRRWD